MSVAVMSAVFQCGPPDQCRRFILIAIADNCDDFGFGCPSVQTIAAKACCSPRTVIRQLEILEQEGWLKVVRHLVGRGNGYFVDIGKIGVTLSPESRLSELHATLRRTQSDKLSSIFLASRPSDRDGFSGDNPQARQVTKRRRQVTTTPFEVTPGVTLTQEPSVEPSLEPSTEENLSPLPPSRGDVPVEHWARFLTRLKSDLAFAPAQFPGGRLNELRPGENDFDVAFRDWWLEGLEWDVGGNACVLVTMAANREVTRRGLDKYLERLKHLARDVFSIPASQNIRFRLVEPQTVNPAA